MKRTLNTNEMVDALRADDNAKWSYEGATALIEHLEERERELEEESEFNVVEIRCEYSEYEDLNEIYKAYSFRVECEYCDKESGDLYVCSHCKEGLCIALNEKEFKRWLEDHTNTILEFNGGVIITQF